MSIAIMLNEPLCVVQSDLHGYLLENLGTVIYDGVWVGEHSEIPNVGGIRKALIDHLRAIKASVIRWPGGNFADYYDWKDGVGPRASRPRRTNMWWDSMPKGCVAGPQLYDPNEFGTPEFMQLCRLSGCKPCLGVNLRALPAQEFSRWVEYCNSPEGSTTLAELRAADGCPEPHGVRYWSIGNEVWAAGGNMEVEDYAGLYKRFVFNVPTFDVDLKFIACGGPPPSTDTQWLREFLSICKRSLAPIPIGAVSIHYYATQVLEDLPLGHTIEQLIADGPDQGAADVFSFMPDALSFGPMDWYDVLAKSAKLETIIESHWNTMAEFDPSHNIKIAVDEWGAFYRPGTELNPLNIRGRVVTLRDALAAALTLDIFNRHAEKLLLANFTGLINQEGGLFLAEGGKFVATPIYHVFHLYSAHQGGQTLRTIFDTPTIDMEENGKVVSVQGLSGSASISGRDLTLTVVNPHTSEAAETSIKLHGGEVFSASVTTLAHVELTAHNTFEHPERVTPVTSPLSYVGSKFHHTFPPASISRLTLRLTERGSSSGR